MMSRRRWATTVAVVRVVRNSNRIDDACRNKQRVVDTTSLFQQQTIAVSDELVIVPTTLKNAGGLIDERLQHGISRLGAHDAGIEPCHANLRNLVMNIPG